MSRLFAALVALTATLGEPPPAGAATLATIEEFRGTLVVVWGDPGPDAGGKGAVFYRLVAADGTSLDLDVGARPGLANEVLAYFGKPVVVRGARSLQRAAGPDRVIVQSITGDFSKAGDARAAVATAPTTTTRRVLYLLLKFADDTGVPHAPQFYLDMTDPLSPPPGSGLPVTLNQFFHKTSGGRLSWDADVGGEGGLEPTGWLTLPHPRSHYVPCNSSAICTDWGGISNDGATAGKAEGIDFTVYDNINFVMSNDLDCCAWGGATVIDGKVFGATWEPPWGQEPSTYVHELGHSLGLPHSGWVYYAYDSPWDMMSSRVSLNSQPCGSYTSANNNGSVRDLYCHEPGNGYIGPHKDRLGWIASSNRSVVSARQSLTTSLEGSALPEGSAIKLIKVCLPCEPCDGPNAHFLTVEARTAGQGATSQFDNGIYGDGVILHDVRMDRPTVSGTCFWNSQSGWAQPIDATPGDWNGAPTCNGNGFTWPYALGNAQWLPGQTYTDQGLGLSVQIGNRSGSAYAVTVNPGGANPSLPGCNVCGDLLVDSGEQCDDGNLTDGDGCDSNCRTTGCGNGVATAGEQCDDGNLVNGDCCSSTCTLVAPGTPCSDDGKRCTSDACDSFGICAHPTKFGGTICRSSVADCDSTEYCDGVSADCPADTFWPSTTPCTWGTLCDPAEYCTGTSPYCPPDLKSTVVCRPALDVCDKPESCDGVSSECPYDDYQPSTRMCRASAGVCDAAEYCTGGFFLCPSDQKSTSACRASAGICDVAETCDGVSNSCPANGFQSSSVVCRSSAGVCDLAESCSGTSASCPSDAKRGGVCRSSAGVCDVAESCDGSATTCPADMFATSAVACRPVAGVCDLAEQCSGTSASCPSDSRRGGVCRSSNGVCDVAESCSGSGNSCPGDSFASSTATCRPAAGVCDLAEQCTGTSPSCPGDSRSSAVCRSSAGVCDVAESCNGSATTCPADTVSGSGVVCRGSAGVCDVAESCTGSTANCPADVRSTIVCRAAAGVCDLAESCDGSAALCPADTKSTNVCRPDTGVCDEAESCTGAGNACPADTFATSAVVCRSAAGECDQAEACSGASALCPVDALVPSGTGCSTDGNPCTDDVCDGQTAGCNRTANASPCNDGSFCNGADTCSGASCSIHAGSPCAGADGDSNCSESCNEASDSCTAADPDGSSCTDGLDCTNGDQCQSGTCSGEPGPSCSTTTTTLPSVVCGDANDDGRVTASDALAVLRAAVGSASCDPVACDYNGDGNFTASDALSILRVAVGQAVPPNCGASAGRTVTTTLATTTTTM